VLAQALVVERTKEMVTAKKVTAVRVALGFGRILLQAFSSEGIVWMELMAEA
jgi:hypothetical protein